MKKLLLSLILLLTTTTFFSQSYLHTAGTINTCRGQYFSSTGGPTKYGGVNGYANNQNVTETFCSATGGQFRANFYWVDLETGFDFLYIYDGPSTASPLIGTLTGSSFYPGVFTSSGTCLTFRFVSDGSGRWGGWNALFGCTPQNCGTNSIPSDDCGSAPIICNLDGYCGSTSGWFTRDHGNIEGSTWGGNNSFSCGSIQNNSWISFIASATSANFNITSNGCADPTTGIQAVVFAQTACTTFTAVSACQGNAIGTFALNATGLTIGQTYYIMIDGVDGNDCDYVVQATGGVQTVKVTSNGNTACVGAAFTLTATATGAGPFTYNWVPAPISGQGTTAATYTAASSTTYSCIIGGACGSSQTAVFTQPINPAPTLTVTGTNTICSAGPATTLTVNGSSGSPSIAYSNNTDYNVPDNNTTGVTSTISVSGIPGTVGSLLNSICLNIQHGYDADLDIILTCPGGTTVDLSSDNGGAGDDYINTCFANSGTSIALGTAPFTGSFTPEQALSVLSGCNANGTWSLTVKDDSGLDVGILQGWTLNFTNNISFAWSPSTGLSTTTGSVTVASPTATTVYSVVATDAAGCTGTTNYTVTVNPTPTVAITSTPSSSLCLGSSLTFTAATANTYTWTASAGGGLSSTSGANVGATPTSTGTITYTVNASSSAGCPASAVKTITVNPVPTANAGTGGTLTCTSSTLALSGSGGGTYSWTGPGIVSGSTTATPVVNAAGNYSLVVTNAFGCPSPASVVSISQNTVVPAVTASVSAVLNCTNTSVNVVATTTTTPVSYTWTGTGITAGSNASSATVNQPGTFNYTVTNTSNGCKTTGSQAVTQNTTAPTITVSATQTITCASPTVTMIGSSTPSTCTPLWTGGVSSGAGTFTATAASSNAYTLTVTNPANACTASAVVNVVPSAGFPDLSSPVISNSITCTTATAQAVVTTTTSNVSYSWTGTGIVGPTNTPTIIVNAGGTFSLAVTNTLSSCTSSITAFVPTNTTAPSPSATNATTLTCTTTTASLIGGPTSGVTYQWSGPSLSGPTTNSTAIAAGPGTYTLKVTSSVNGCTNTAVTTVSQNTTTPSPTATNATTLTCLTTTATLTGGPSSGVTYQWSGPSLSGPTTNSTAIAAGPGTYTLKVTDAVNGCTNTAVTTVTQNIVPPSPTASTTNTLTCVTNSATLTGGPTSGVTYQWSGPALSGATTNSTAIATAPGTYTLLVTNSVNGCTNTATAALTQNITLPSPTASTGGTLTCAVTTVSISGTPSSGVTYQWSGPSITSATTNSLATVNNPGTYTLLVTNSVNGCTNTATTNVTTNYTSPNPTATNATTLTCAITTATITGGPAAGVTYLWSGPSIVGPNNGQNIVVNAPGTYVLQVISTLTGCDNSVQAIVDQNTVLPVSAASNSTTLTCTTNTAALTGGPASGVTYQWSGPGFSGGTTSQNATATSPGTYTITVTDIVNSCTDATTVAVTQNTTAPVPTASNSTTLTCTTSTAALTGGPASGVIYQWSGPGFSGGTTSQNAIANAPGTYTLKVTSTVNSCTAIATTAVSQNTTAPVPAASNSTTLTCTTSTAALTGGPASGVTYQWSGPGFSGGTTSQNATATLPGTYTLLVTSTVNSCTAAATAAVSQNTTAPVPTASNSTTLTCTTTTAALTGGPASGVTYQWSGPGFSGGTTSQNATATLPGTYTLLVTSTVNSCTAAATTAVSQNTTAPVPTASNSTTLTCTTSTAALTGGPASGVTYQWSGPGFSGGTTSQNATATLPGTYTLLVTSTVNSCTAAATAAVSQNTTAPVPTASNSTTLTCTTTTAALTGGPASGATYQWSGPGFSGGTTSQNATATLPGTYTLLVTSTVNSCTATATAAVSQNTTTPGITMPLTQTITCASPSVSLIGSANPSTCTAVWTGGVCSGATTFTAAACSPNTYTLTVTNPINGCTNSGTVNAVASVGVPSVTASNSGFLTCTNLSSQIVATTTMSPVSYSWSGPGAVSGASTSTGTVSVGGSYQCVVTNTLTGCASTITTIVPTNTTPVAASIAPTSSINCLVTTQVLNASPIGSYSYSWTPNASLTGTTVSTPTVSTGGTYSVVITNTINGCVGSASIAVVSNTVIPTVTISPSSFTTTCSTPTVQLTANTSTNSVSYNWSSPASGTLTSSSSSNPIASGAGIFTVVVTNTVNGCISSGSTSSITLDVVIPTATLSATSLSITCATPTPSTSVSTSTSAVSYNWTPSTGISAGANTANPSFSLAGTYSVVVTNTINGCTSSISSNVVNVVLNNTIPTITISPSQTLTCTTPSITVSTTVNPNSGVIYNWTGNGVTGLTTSTVDVNQPGVYSTTVTNPVNGCSVTANVSITSNTTSPVATIAVNSITTTCAAPTATLNASSTPSTGVSYNWNAPGTGSLNTFTVSNPIAGGSGIFTVTVTDNTNGCSTAVSQATVEIIPDAATPVVNVSANSLTITCTNTTVTTALTSTNTIASYNWNPTPSTGGANPVFDTPGVYSATITATNGCPTNISVNVSLDNTIPTITLSSAINGGTITCTNTLVTITPTVTPSANLTYTWSPSGVTSSSLSSATFTAAGIYTLAITNTLTGCVTSLTNTANSFTVIADNATPTFTLGTAGSVTTTCAAPNATLSGSSNADPNAVYTWTTPSSSTLVGNPIVSSGAGTYSVIVTNTINGCSTSASSPATVDVVADSGIPNVTLSANSLSITCSNPTPSVAVTTTASPVSYNWTPATGIVPGTETTANPVFNAAGSYSVVVTNTASGCATSILNNVVDVTLDNTIPVITLSSAVNSGTITCTNTLVTITPTITPSANLTYTWSPSGVVSSSINDASFTTVGVYTLAVTNTLTGCVSTSTSSANTFTVFVDNAVVTASINALSSNTVIGCGAGNSSVILGSTISSSNPIITWLPGSVSTPTLDVTTAGIYTLVVVDAASSCSTTTQYTVDGSTTPPQGVDAGAAANIACGGTTVTLIGVTTTSNTSFSWSGPSATSIIAGTETTLIPTVTEAGDYTLTVTDNLTGCSSSDVVTVTQAIATASITANPTSGISPLDVAFTGAGAGSPTYSWSFGDGNTSNAQNPNNTFTTGTYTVILTTTSGTCTATATVEIVVEDGLTLEIPNVFTPNNDGANDLFTIKSTGVKEISLQIFNRWGEKLYEFSGAKASWDGLAPNGAEVPEGTYFYFVKATGFDGQEIEKHETLNLFR